MKKFSCKDAKAIDMVEYLGTLGYHPVKSSRGNDYWYLSPLPERNEKTPSFKVDRKKNLWYDHGIGKGGDIIDFGIIFHSCSVSELLQKLLDYKCNSLSVSSSALSKSSTYESFFAGEKKKISDSKIVLVETRSLSAEPLIDYLKKRCIPLELADEYCKEVDFLLYSKLYTAIGFENNSGGFELRSENFKGSSSPKDIRLIGNNIEKLSVFEGFFSFLSFATIYQHQPASLTDCLVLNSLSFFEKSRQLMDNYSQVHLLLDRDKAGINYTRQTLSWNKERYIDHSAFYNGYKDFNEWLIHHQCSLKQKLVPRHNKLF